MLPSNLLPRAMFSPLVWYVQSGPIGAGPAPAWIRVQFATIALTDQADAFDANPLMTIELDNEAGLFDADPLMTIEVST